jgi:hypothetical protein
MSLPDCRSGEREESNIRIVGETEPANEPISKYSAASLSLLEPTEGSIQFRTYVKMLHTILNVA